ncbi:MAG: carotenoid oxygenase family protein [Prochloraceae cyanobacterium]|nr:carotenoid oxygenase family protein [Prochloraceae cyanobacterium]
MLFFNSITKQLTQKIDITPKIIDGVVPENLSGHIFIAAPTYDETISSQHRFAAVGAIVRWDFNDDGQVKVTAKRIATWENFWRSTFPLHRISHPFFPAEIDVIETTELANMGVVKMGERLIVTADAGRYWEIDPITLDTISPVGYFDENIVSQPLSFFPLIANTAKPFFERDSKQLFSCQLNTQPQVERYSANLVGIPHITAWDGGKDLKHWLIEGTALKGMPHQTIVTHDFVLVPDFPYRMGISVLMGLSIKQNFSCTDIYIVERLEMTQERQTVSARRITFDGATHSLLSNYYPIDNKLFAIAIQQATIDNLQTIQPGDVIEYNGKAYTKDYYGIPWMFAFAPGVLRKIVIRAEKLISEEVFTHPGWFTASFHTADPRELYSENGYSAIFQVYAGMPREFISRRQYQNLRFAPNKVIKSESLPQQDLPSVLAKIPLNLDWNTLTQKIESSKLSNPDTFVTTLGKEQLDFFVFPEGHILGTIQFIPTGTGYIFATVLTDSGSQAWIFNAQSLNTGAICKIKIPSSVDLGYTMYSEYFSSINKTSTNNYKIDRIECDRRSITSVIDDFFKI